ncbi:MAG: FmdB family zinc ribbon protein [Bryobacteraceae bacterium]
MPIYEYRCHQCSKTFERIQKFSDQPVKVHEDCGGEVERLISRSSLQFKGTGWYVTDYGRNGKLPSTNGSNGQSEGKSEGKSENKPEGKSESQSEPSKSESKPAASTPSSSEK